MSTIGGGDNEYFGAVLQLAYDGGEAVVTDQGMIDGDFDDTHNPDVLESGSGDDGIVIAAFERRFQEDSASTEASCYWPQLQTMRPVKQFRTKTPVNSTLRL